MTKSNLTVLYIIICTQAPFITVNYLEILHVSNINVKEMYSFVGKTIIYLPVEFLLYLLVCVVCCSDFYSVPLGCVHIPPLNKNSTSV